MSALRILLATRHRGQTIVLFALMSLVLMAGLGLVIDAGVNYAQRRNMQNAADTAALAGARVIARQSSPELGTITRQLVWDAVYETAWRNGLPQDEDLLECEYVNSSRALIGTSCKVTTVAQGNLTIPSAASGVLVRAREEHTTFFMRAVGIQTSGTAATSMAQVQIVREMARDDVLFAVCGLQTRTSAGGRVDILQWKEVENMFVPDPSPSPRPPLRTATDQTSILDSVIKYDWNQREANGDLIDLAGWTFVIQGANIATCNTGFANWFGLITPANDSTEVLQMPANGGDGFIRPVDLKTGTLAANAGPANSINGTKGCQTGQNPNDCVMLLPITNNHTDPGASRSLLEARVWGAFWITQSGSDYHGALIKNYPLHTNGEASWTTSYRGPVAVTLVKTD